MRTYGPSASGQKAAQYSPSIIIAKKRDGKELSTSEIQNFIQGVTSGEVPDYQTTALLMAIYLQGFNDRETADLTDAMLYSGEALEFSQPEVIDKHSTGGVGDKTSLILAPLAAACGVKVPMIAGRGLGHTAGTVDKIEAIEGFQTEITLQEFQKNVIERNIVLIGQTADIAPADKKIYALRDVSGTIESIPLITASIMSKKLAEGARGIVLDIKCGPGAFMKTKTRAKQLAKSLQQTALRFDRHIITMITDMSQPLGKTIGHSLELIESFETLKNRGPKDLTELSLSLAGGMIHLAGKAKTHKAGIKMAKAALVDGSGLEMMKKLIEFQGGNKEVVDNYDLLPSADETIDVIATKSGYLAKIDNEGLGLTCVELGGGRKTKEDKIDFGVGLTMLKRLGQRVKKGEPLLTIHYHSHQTAKSSITEREN